MTTYLIEAWLHLVAGILLVGNALFWVVMAIGVGRASNPAESTRLLGVINAGRWPHVAVPRALRLPFPAVAWTFLLVLAITGVLLMERHGAMLGAVLTGSTPADRFAGLLGAKLALFGLLIAGQVGATVSPRRWLAFLNGGLTLAIVVLSALLRR